MSCLPLPSDKPWRELCPAQLGLKHPPWTGHFGLGRQAPDRQGEQGLWPEGEEGFTDTEVPVSIWVCSHGQPPRPVLNSMCPLLPSPQLLPHPTPCLHMPCPPGPSPNRAHSKCLLLFFQVSWALPASAPTYFPGPLSPPGWGP